MPVGVWTLPANGGWAAEVEEGLGAPRDVLLAREFRTSNPILQAQVRAAPYPMSRSGRDLGRGSGWLHLERFQCPNRVTSVAE